MKTKEKRMILILIVVSVLIILGLLMAKNNKNEQENTLEEYVTVLDDGTKLNTSEKLKENKNIEGVEITNIQLTEKAGQTMLLADATNKTEKETPIIGVKIIVLNKKGEEIGKILGAVSPLKVGETKQLIINITEDYANAYNFRVEKQ